MSKVDTKRQAKTAIQRLPKASGPVEDAWKLRLATLVARRKANRGK